MKIILHKFINWILTSTLFSTDSSHFLKYKELDDADKIMKQKLDEWMINYQKKETKIKILDLGGGDGIKLKEFLNYHYDKFECYTLDIVDNKTHERLIIKDITQPIEKELENKFDVVYSYNSFEHFNDPLTAADNVYKFLKENGICLVHTVFSWRYHPAPKDYFRYTDDALKYLFCERNKFKVLACGYDISRRRENITGGYFEDKDIPPIDVFGGFRENWSVYFIGIKH